MRHVIPQRFPDAQWIDLPKTSYGANTFDQLYRLDDGTLVIAEAKAPQARPIWRKGAGEADGWMVQQGTRPYVETILFEMEKNFKLPATDSAGNPVRDASGKPVTIGDIADLIAEALESGKLRYVMVKAAENPGTYAGAKLEHFQIDQEERTSGHAHSPPRRSSGSGRSDRRGGGSGGAGGFRGEGVGALGRLEQSDMSRRRALDTTLTFAKARCEVDSNAPSRSSRSACRRPC
ncbi:hypothetical protein [Streptomyces sp. HM190]|uniref:hypothetical protein n=1 Tax=Streptomyces sp. HM190 TaxID=2695266 RepID=UPI00135C742B|nr:hypothetical protein [Streptomyces sp. HM190]